MLTIHKPIASLLVSLVFFLQQGWAQDTLKFVAVARTAQARVQPGGVLVLAAKISNSSDEPADGIIVASVAGSTDQQSARRVTVRPKSEAQYDIYVNLPASLAGKESVEIVLTMQIEDNGRQVTLARDGVPVSYSMTMSVDRLPNVAGFAMQPSPQELPYWFWPPTPIYSDYEMAVAARVDSGNSRQTSNFDDVPIPVGKNDLSNLDLLVVSEPEKLNDASAREAVKRYLHDGGRVWITLDTVGADLIQGFFGDSQSCAVVDTVELNQFVVDMHLVNSPLAEIDRTIEKQQGRRTSPTTLSPSNQSLFRDLPATKRRGKFNCIPTR